MQTLVKVTRAKHSMYHSLRQPYYTDLYCPGYSNFLQDHHSIARNR